MILFLQADLISYGAGSLAGRLAGSLALAAAFCFNIFLLGDII